MDFTEGNVYRDPITAVKSLPISALNRSNSSTHRSRNKSPGIYNTNPLRPTTSTFNSKIYYNIRP